MTSCLNDMPMHERRLHLLGLLREEKCFAARILLERGLRLRQIGEELETTARARRCRCQEGLPYSMSSVFTSAIQRIKTQPLVGNSGDQVPRPIRRVICQPQDEDGRVVGEKCPLNDAIARLERGLLEVSSMPPARSIPGSSRTELPPQRKQKLNAAGILLLVVGNHYFLA